MKEKLKTVRFSGDIQRMSFLLEARKGDDWVSLSFPGAEKEAPYEIEMVDGDKFSGFSESSESFFLNKMASYLKQNNFEVKTEQDKNNPEKLGILKAKSAKLKRSTVFGFMKKQLRLLAMEHGSERPMGFQERIYARKKESAKEMIRGVVKANTEIEFSRDDSPGRKKIMDLVTQLAISMMVEERGGEDFKKELKLLLNKGELGAKKNFENFLDSMTSSYNFLRESVSPENLRGRKGK